MSCCGNKRALFNAARPVTNSFAQPPGNVPTNTLTARAASPVPVIFEYIGPTGMSVLGSVTQRLYRFDARMARISVDARDVPSLSSVPNLKRVR